MAVVDALGTAIGAATVTGAAGVLVVVGGTSLGQATAFGDTAWWGSGTAMGVGELLPTDAVRRRDAGGVAMGMSAMFGQVGIIHLSSGTAYGVGTLIWDNQQEAGGTAVGTSLMSGEPLIYRGAGGIARGTSALLWSIPDVIRGSSLMFGDPVVERALPPIKAILPPPKQFRYGQRLTRGGLSIYLCNQAGPIIPAHISFTLYQVRSDGSRFRVGPKDRIPVPGSIGEFYVTGSAGECGQPGCWQIEWVVQQNGLSPVQTRRMDFLVVDAAASPCDNTPRVRKYGWS